MYKTKRQRRREFQDQVFILGGMLAVAAILGLFLWGASLA